MLSQRDAHAILDRALALSPLKEAELTLTESTENLTRFGSNAITQNVSRRKRALGIHLRDVRSDGAHEGATEVNQLDDASIRAGFEKAATILRLSKPNEKSLPFLATPQKYAPTSAARDGIEQHSPAARAKVIGRAIERAKSEQLEASGVFAADASVTAYANSNGIRAYHPQTTSIFSLTATGHDGDNEGWFEEERESPDELNVERVVETAIAKAKLARRPRAHAPGRYTVILEPAAVAEVIMFLGWLGFGAMRFLEGRSYLDGKLGQKKFSDRLTIRDDVGDPRAPGMPFDYEGVATEKVSLVEKGVAVGLVWDRRTALEAKEKGLGERRSTGHSLPQPSSYGPFPRNVIVEGDERTSLEELIKSTKDGILVSKLHYTNVVNPMDLSITGMTRSGVFKVERGEVAYPVKNFRFTVSLLDVFSKIEALGKPERATGALFGGPRIVAPPMRLAGWNMSSSTEF